MLIKKGFFLIKSQGSDDSYEEEILACSESKCEIQKELDSYSLQSKSELEQFKKICSEIKSYTLKARKFISTTILSESDLSLGRSVSEERRNELLIVFHKNFFSKKALEEVFQRKNSNEQ